MTEWQSGWLSRVPLCGLLALWYALTVTAVLAAAGTVMVWAHTRIGLHRVDEELEAVGRTASTMVQQGSMTRRLSRFVAAGLVGAIVVASAATRTAAQAKDGGKDLADLPAAVRHAIRDNKPGAEIDKLEVERENGITLYDIEFKAGLGEIEVAADGTVIDITTIIDMKDVPEPAAAAIRTAAKGRTIKQVEKDEVRAEVVKEGGTGRISTLPAPKYVYEAELSKGEIEVAADGTVLKSGN